MPLPDDGQWRPPGGSSEPSVGPGDFGASGTAKLVVAAANLRAISRAAAICTRVSGNERTERWLKKLGVESLEGAGWAIVALMHDGPVRVYVVREGTDSLLQALKVEAEWWAARSLPWAVLLIGADDVRGSVATLVETYAEDVANAAAASVQPSLAVTASKNVVVRVGKPDVDRMNFAPTLLAMDALAMESALERVAGRVLLAFDGYDADRRELFEIPSVRAFVRGLAHLAPWAPLIADPEAHILWAACIEDDRSNVRPADAGSISVHFPPDALDRLRTFITIAGAELTAHSLLLESVPPYLQRCLMGWSETLRGGASKQARSDRSDEAAVEVAMESQSRATDERSFWETLLAQVAPGWNVRFVQDERHPTPEMGTLACYVYVLDVRTGWAMATAHSLEQITTIERVTAAEPRAGVEAPSAVITLARELGDRRASALDKDVSLMLLAATAALTLTKTYEVAKAQFGKPIGHFLYLVYSYKDDDDSSGRPVYGSQAEPGFMTLTDTFEVAAQAIRHDLENRSSVGMQIRERGGLRMSRSLRQRVRSL